MSRSVRAIGPLTLLLGLGLYEPPPAGAVQAGGSLSVVPSNWGFLVDGQTVDVVVRANNTSSDTLAASFPDSTGPKAAQLFGPITVTLGCADDACSVVTPGVLAFVSVAPSGCVAKNAAVTSCTSGPGGTVKINFASTISLPAAGSVDIATIRVRVLDDQVVGSTGIQAMSETGALVACSTSLPSLCVGCHADGCTKLAFTANNVRHCPHACISKITFRSGLDTFEFHADIDVAPGFSPATKPFTITLSNALFNPVLTYSLPAGSLQPGTDSWRYLDNGAKKAGGINIVKIGRRDGTVNTYRIDLIVYDPNLETRATVANMTTSFSAGGESFSNTGNWTKSKTGWTFQVP